MSTESEYFDRKDRTRLAIIALAVAAVVSLIFITLAATIHYGVAGFFGGLGLSLFVGAMFGIVAIDR